jgi:hypothetical protein
MTRPKKSTRPTDLKTEFEHGTRSRYVVGCRCASCKEANRLFYHKRIKRKIYGDWNGLVTPGKVRQRLKKLSRKGIGYKTVAKEAGVSRTVLQQVMSGRRKHICARTERKVLALREDCLADHAIIDATETWRQINALLRDVYPSKSALAKALGFKTPAIQIRKDRVLVKNAKKVEKIYNAFLGEKD